MSALRYTAHAMARLQQRGLRPADVELIVTRGTPIPDGYLMRGEDVDEEIARHKHEIATLERLREKMVIMKGGKVLSVYPAKSSKQRRVLRKTRGNIPA